MRAVDLFSGCGGLSLGFTLADHTILAGYDNWTEAINVYRKNFQHPAIQMDLSNIKDTVASINHFHPEMIIGGPPCQDFSSAGKRNENNGRGNLTISFANIVAEVKPQWFVMENVARITQTRKILEALVIFRTAGYGLTQAILDASHCGVPQKRKRFILIGKLGEIDGFMLDVLERNLSEKAMTIADAFGNQLGTNYYYRHPTNYTRRGIFSIDEPSPTIRGINRPIPKNYRFHPNDPIHDLSQVRPLTTQERSLIQTFPADFDFGISSKTVIEQMIGNAVPVNLAKYVGKCINDYLSGNHSIHNYM